MTNASFLRRVGPQLSWLTVAATPAIFAAATWDNRGPADLPLAATRLFGIPVLVVELIVIVIALARDWRPIADFRELPRPAIPLICGLLGVQAYTIAFAAPKPATAIIYSYATILQIVFGFAVAHLARRAGPVGRKRAWPFVVAGVCTYCGMLAMFVEASHPVGFDWQYLGLGVSNVRQLGYYAAVGSASSFGCALSAERWKRGLFLAAASLTLALAAWSGSRGAVLAILVGFIVGIVLAPLTRAGRAVVDAGIVAAVGMALSFLAAPSSQVYGVGRMIGSAAPGAPDVSSGRWDLWRGAWNAILKRPMLGYGEGQFGWVVPLQHSVYLHPHNAPLQLLFQWGIVGTAIFGALAALVARACVRAFRVGPTEAIPAVLVLASLGTLSLYDGALFHAYPVMMVSFSVATLIGFAQSDPALRSQHRTSDEAPS